MVMFDKPWMRIMNGWVEVRDDGDQNAVKEVSRITQKHLYQLSKEFEIEKKNMKS